MITGTNIRKSFNGLEILRGVDIEVKAGEVVSIVGSSGAGKTTLLTILGTLDRPTSGEVRLNGEGMSELNDKKLASFRNRNIGFVFQFHQLLPEFTALENVAIPALIARVGKKQAFAEAARLLAELNLENRGDHKPSELSGGEQQRVAVARALINKPKVIFADEPSGNLDSRNADELHRLFFRLRDSHGQTFVIVTHNQELAGMADRTLTMRDGRIIT
jgi:lipoprotein-releasing system ATP-binding protein